MTIAVMGTAVPTDKLTYPCIWNGVIYDAFGWSVLDVEDLTGIHYVEYRVAERCHPGRVPFARYVIIEAIDRVAAKRRMLPNGRYVIRCSGPHQRHRKSGAAKLDAALARAREIVAMLNSVLDLKSTRAIHSPPEQ